LVCKVQKVYRLTLINGRYPSELNVGSAVSNNASTVETLYLWKRNEVNATPIPLPSTSYFALSNDGRLVAYVKGKITGQRALPCIRFPRDDIT
jgi:hypothetical protein